MRVGAVLVALLVLAGCGAEGVRPGTAAPDVSLAPAGTGAATPAERPATRAPASTTAPPPTGSAGRTARPAPATSRPPATVTKDVPRRAGTTSAPAPVRTRPVPEPTGGTRPGAPYDIAPFDNVGGPVANFRDSVTARCGAPRGAAGCLTVVEDGVVEDPLTCRIASISYAPVPGPREASDAEKKLRRGTTVTAVVTCPPPEETTP